MTSSAASQDHTPMSPSHAPILVVVDPTREDQPALARAAGYARRRGAPLVLVAAVYDPYLAGEDRYPGIELEKQRQALVGHHLTRLRAHAKPLARSGLRVTCRAVFDQPLHEAIVREVLRHQPAMVVKDTHRHGALSRLFLTNTDWHLIRDCPATLWLVKPGEPSPYASVVAAVDPLHGHDKPGSLDRAIISQAQELGVLYGERVHVLHAYNPAIPGLSAPMPGIEAMPAAVPPALVEQLRIDHARALDTLAADVGLPEGQVHLRAGDPATVVVEAARELDAAIVVMGAVARSRLKRAFIGSTAERALEDIPCDIVVLKPEGFESPVSARNRVADYLARTANYGRDAAGT
jgi:universal stress protein E